MSKPRVLFSIPTRYHVEIALDEMEGLQELGYPCDQFPYAAKEGVTSKLGRIQVIVKNALNLVKVAKQFKPDIIYFNSRLEAIAGMRDYITILLFKSLYRKEVRFILKSHGSDIDVFKGNSLFIGKTVVPYLKRHIAGWLFLSFEEKQQVTTAGHLPAGKVFVTKNIVRTKQFVKDELFKKKLNLPSDYKILLYVGRLIKEKGAYHVIEAFAQVKDKYPVVLLIVGWGPEEAALKQLCMQHELGNKVIFTGFIPEQQVVTYYASSDILVFPTYFPEGFPMSLFNSVAAGLPVITTPTRAATDYLSDPENCLWVKPQDTDSVATAMHTLLQSEALMLSMRQNNLLKGTLFSKQQVCAELGETLNQIMQS
jgi:glycosyltransferase involved in cell wall biosynthesis